MAEINAIATRLMDSELGRPGPVPKTNSDQAKQRGQGLKLPKLWSRRKSFMNMEGGDDKTMLKPACESSEFANHSWTMEVRAASPKHGKINGLAYFNGKKCVLNLGLHSQKATRSVHLDNRLSTLASVCIGWRRRSLETFDEQHFQNARGLLTLSVPAASLLILRGGGVFEVRLRLRS